ncbi:MAG: cupin domain-containing protein [Proteobacteria bacterium]|nr:cupin domain-containing protein [Pseudomonadota bacterium]
MKIPEQFRPLNPELMDTLVPAGESDWIPNDDSGMSFVKVLYTGEESGQWAALFRWSKGYVAGPHKHLSAAHTYVLKGRLQVRDGTLEAGDYVYERNGMIHEATTALEDTEYLFICEGPVLFFDEQGIQGYLGWEELARLKAQFEASRAA